MIIYQEKTLQALFNMDRLDYTEFCIVCTSKNHLLDSMNQPIEPFQKAVSCILLVLIVIDRKEN